MSDEGAIQSNSIGLSDIFTPQKPSKPGKPAKRYQEDLPISTPWRTAIERSIAKSKKIRGSNFVQLATVSVDNEPRVRTVVFRGFVAKSGDDSTTMKLITDLRSEKVVEIKSQSDNMAELLWWFGKSSEQYRVRCTVKLIGDECTDPEMLKLRKEQWGNLSDKAREQFYWRSPGDEFEPQCWVPPGGRGEDGTVLPPPSTFLLALLYPRRVDYLRLTDDYRQVDSYDEEHRKWSLERVNP